MRKKLLILIALMLTGAIVNLTIAVLAAVYSPINLGGTTEYDKGRLTFQGPPPESLRSIAPDEWIDFDPPKDGFYRLYHVRAAGFALMTDAVITDLSFVGVDPYSTGNRMALRVQSGWPLACLQCTGVVGLPTPRNPPRLSVYWQGSAGESSESMHIMFLPADLNVGRPIPARIMPAGLAINSALFAAVVGIPAWVLRRLRRYRRMLKGLCPRCKYPTAGLAACPECGWDNPLSRVTE